MKKVPYGISNYKKLREEDYIYVDKTMYLEKLESIGYTLMYLRPGRFGKSLFTSMMYYYYDINSECLFDSLFKETYVYNNPTKNKNNYYILKFDFSGISLNAKDIESLEREFRVCVINGINAFLSYYKIEYEIDKNDSASSILKLFLTYINGLELKHKIYIIIDEYDNFTNGILEGDTTIFKSIVTETGFVKPFYAAIKEYIGLGVVDRFFATGICPITLNSMTTGFNISKDLSSNKEFASMIGLTHEEVKKLINEYDQKEELYKIMIENYDGYLFSDELEEEKRTFNATLVMYLLDNYERYREIPKVLYDNNIVVNYDKIENLIKLQNNEFWQELINEILTTQEVSGNFRTSFNLNVDFDRNDIISLLYYFGYLTIKESGIRESIRFRIPNEMMRVTYNNYFLKLLKDMNIKLDNKVLDESVLEIINEGTINNISNYVSEILEKSGNRLFLNFNEKCIQVSFISLLSGAKEYKIYSEYEINGGYVDIYLKGNREYMAYDIMIELKYIKKENYSELEVENKKKEGIEQIKRYSSDLDLSKLKRYVVVFVGKELKIIEMV